MLWILFRTYMFSYTPTLWHNASTCFGCNDECMSPCPKHPAPLLPIANTSSSRVTNSASFPRLPNRGFFFIFLTKILGLLEAFNLNLSSYRSLNMQSLFKSIRLSHSQTFFWQSLQSDRTHFHEIGFLSR